MRHSHKGQDNRKLLNTSVVKTVDYMSLCKPCRDCGRVFKHWNFHQYRCEACDPEPFQRHDRLREQENARRRRSKG